MARPIRIEFPGAVYHITARGNERKEIFLDAQDRNDFIEILALVVERFGWRCHTYCLMGNHYHLLIETPKGNVSKGMRQLNGVYAQNFNRKYKRVGHLFQGRYKAILVEKEAYLLELSRYIVLNPVKARFVEQVEEWPWSSYRAIIGENQKPGFLTTDWILEQFGKNKKKSINAYKTFVISGAEVEFPLDEIVGQLILGSEKFLRDINRHIGEKNIVEISEYPREQRLSSDISLDNIFQKEMSAGKTRDEIIYSIYYERDYTQKEIAEYLGIHYTTISRIIKRFEQRKKR